MSQSEIIAGAKVRKLPFLVHTIEFFSKSWYARQILRTNLNSARKNLQEVLLF